MGAGALAFSRSGLAWAQAMGPSSAVAPYVLPSMDGVEATALITTGEAAENGYRMVGIPDGLGAFMDG
ncbi:MAG: hypothetical protein QOF51_3237, partial [Chloroflexota bacterium]|nr:hypothetical protein [Chloroflexota bacterium]